MLQQVAQGQEHAIAVIAGERKRRSIEHAHEARIASLV
jgi:hypothetical protein